MSCHTDSLSWSMMFIQQTVFKTTGPWNIGHSDLHLRLNIWSYWLIIPKYGVHISNSLQDIRQNHWPMKYRSQWPTFIFRSNVVSYWLTILKYDVHISNSLQDIKQNHWTMKYRSQSPAFILRQTSVHTDLWFQSMMFIDQIVFKI